MSRLLGLLGLAATLTLAACGGPDTPSVRPPADAVSPPASGKTLVVYARERAIAEPLFETFEKRTAITIQARWGNPIDLAEQVIAEGDDSPADVFYAPMSDALGALSAAGRLDPLPLRLLNRVPPQYRSPEGTWVGTTGRAHVAFYNTDKVSEADLPDSIEGFADPAWRGRIGWDPTSRSLQAAVDSIRQLEGENRARAWLEGVQANRPAALKGTAPLIDAVSAGRIIDVGFGSHYYLYDARARGEASNVAAKFYPGDPGGLLNVAGIGIVKGGDQQGAARALVEFMLSRTVQRIYAERAYEIPLVDGASPVQGIPAARELVVRGLDVRQLETLETTRRLLTEAEAIG